MVAPCNLGGNVQGFMILKVILYIKCAKYGVSKAQAPSLYSLVPYEEPVKKHRIKCKKKKKLVDCKSRN